MDEIRANSSCSYLSQMGELVNDESRKIDCSAGGEREGDLIGQTTGIFRRKYS